MASRTDISFHSGGITLRGWLFRPEPVRPERPVPAVVMAEGFAGVKEMTLARFAEPLAEAGIATVAFDHPCFGTSDGEPRQRLHPREQVAAYADALTFAATVDGLDPTRLGAWGVSFSGGHVISLISADPRVRAAVAVVPFTGVPRRDVAARVLRGLRRRELRTTGTLPVFAPDPDATAFIPGPGAYAAMMEFTVTLPTFRNEITADSLAKIAAYRPLRHADAIHAPLRVIAMSEDTVTPAPAARRFAQRMRGRVDYIELAGGHFSATRERYEPVRDLSVDWLVRHLLG